MKPTLFIKSMVVLLVSCLVWEPAYTSTIGFAGMHRSAPYPQFSSQALASMATQELKPYATKPASLIRRKTARLATTAAFVLWLPWLHAQEAPRVPPPNRDYPALLNAYRTADPKIQLFLQIASQPSGDIVKIPNLHHFFG